MTHQAFSRSKLVPSDVFAASVQQSAHALHELAASSYGPAGRFKAIRSQLDAESVTVTSCSSRIFGNLALKDPISRLLCQTLTNHVAAYSDGGLFMMLMATGLTLKHCETRLDAQAEHVLWVEGCQLGLEWLTEYWTADACPCRVYANLDMKTVKALLRSTLSSKALAVPQDLGQEEQSYSHTPLLHEHSLSNTGVEYLCVLIIEAWVESMDDGAELSASPIRTVSVTGPSIMQSQCVDGHVLDTFVPLESPEMVTAPLVALFDVSVGVDEQEMSRGFDIEMSASQVDRLVSRSVRDQEVRALVDVLDAAGVGLVACQKLLSRQFKALLLERGIVPLDRLSSRHISTVQSLSGCTILSIACASSIRPENLGRLASVEKVTFGNDLRSYLVLRPDPETFKPVRTLVLCADDHCASEELSAAVSGCIATLQSVALNPTLLAGGGCAEIMAAEHVRLKAKGLKAGLEECGNMKHACAAERQCVADGTLAFASVLESCASSLAPGSGLVQAVKRANGIDEGLHTASSLRSGPTYDLFGWDTLCNEPRIVASMMRPSPSISAAVQQTKPQWDTLAVLDSLAMKLSAVKVATDVASMIARLNNSIM